MLYKLLNCQLYNVTIIRGTDNLCRGAPRRDTAKTKGARRMSVHQYACVHIYDCIHICRGYTCAWAYIYHMQGHARYHVYTYT